MSRCAREALALIAWCAMLAACSEHHADAGRSASGPMKRSTSSKTVDGMRSSADSGMADTGIAAGRPMARVDYTRGDFYDAPFPDEQLRRDDGTVDVSGFPNVQAVGLIDQFKAML